MESVTNNQGKTLHLGPGKYKGVSVSIFAVVATPNTAFGATVSETFDYSQISITVQRTKKGSAAENKEPEKISSDNLLNYVYCSEYKKPTFEYVVGANNTTSIILVAAASGVQAVSQIPLKFHFGPNEEVIHVGEGEELDVYLKFGSGSFGADIDKSQTFLQWDGIVGHGIEKSLPLFSSISIDPADENVTKHLGSNIHRIVLANLDKSGVLQVDQVANTVEVTAKHGFSRMFDFTSMLTEQDNDFVSASLAAIRAQSFLIHEAKDMDEVLDGCKVTLALQKANVSAGMNYILYMHSKIDDEIVTKAVIEEHRKDTVHAAKASINVSLVPAHLGNTLPKDLQATHAAHHTAKRR